MPTITINKGDTLSKIAIANGTSVAELLSANQGNPSVKSANLIIAGGSINLPEKVAAPAAGPSPAAELPLGGMDATGVQDEGAKGVGDLGNLRIALRSALNEAAARRVESNFKQVAPFSTGVPGTMGAVVDMIRSGIKTPVETTFSDILSAHRDATEAKQKELDRINDLRKEFGSVIPSSVTDLRTALDLAAPLIDKENRLRFEKMAKDLSTSQAQDDDIESWAYDVARDPDYISKVPTKIRTAVKVRADALRSKLEEEAKQEYKDGIAFRIERKTSNYEQERTLALQDENLSVKEQREVLDYIDSLEQEQKAAKRSSGSGFKNPFASQPFKYETTPTSLLNIK